MLYETPMESRHDVKMSEYDEAVSFLEDDELKSK